MILFFKSSKPSKGSNTSPKLLFDKLMARALMVKSRRFWSSLSDPLSTIGLRESLLYDSFLAPTNSTSKPFIYFFKITFIIKLYNN